jgi:signal transduction histidine kinase
LALVSIVVFGAALFALLSYVYQTTTTFVLSRSDAAINREWTILRRAYDSGGRDGLSHAIDQALAAERLSGARYLFADASFIPISGNLPHWPPDLSGAEGVTEFQSDSLDPKTPERSLFRARWETIPSGLHLLVGSDIAELRRFENGIYYAFALTILFIVVLAGAASFSVTRRTVGRIESINATTCAIMESGLDTRISLRWTNDECDQLARNLNAMLDRIESLMGEVKQVSDNVAHDLRTPLTRMRGRLERAGMTQRNPERDQALLSDTIADLDDVLRMFAALTRISQIEIGNQTSTFRMVNLAEVTTQVAELFDAAAEENGGRVEAEVREPVFVLGDRDLLFDAVSNLVDNAIKHGRTGGRVSITADQSETTRVLTVSDDGPGIPLDEMGNVFKRFYRSERSRCTPGNGLGLSLVAAVARVHGATIALFNNAPGLRAELSFPVAPQASQIACKPETEN